MQVRTGGVLPFRFDLNPLMLLGMIIFLSGAAWYGAEEMGMAPSIVVIDANQRLAPDGSSRGDLTLGSVAFMVALGGVALYFVGRVVQIAGLVAKRRSAAETSPGESA
ncbi:MAG: hypothetical protein ACYTDX_06730 [Planctomycetota bacterium]|jgi:hypothetical protein